MSLAAERGHYVVVTFLYTHCPDVCPVIAGNLNRVLATPTARRAGLRVLAVSVDPKRDTPAAVAPVRPRAPARAGLPLPDRDPRAARAGVEGLPRRRRRPGRTGTVAHSTFEILVDPRGPRAPDLRLDRRRRPTSSTTSRCWSGDGRRRDAGAGRRHAARPPAPRALRRRARSAVDRRRASCIGRARDRARADDAAAAGADPARRPERAARALRAAAASRLPPDDGTGDGGSRRPPIAAAPPPSRPACSRSARRRPPSRSARRRARRSASAASAARRCCSSSSPRGARTAPPRRRTSARLDALAAARRIRVRRRSTATARTRAERLRLPRLLRPAVPGAARPGSRAGDACRTHGPIGPVSSRYGVRVVPDVLRDRPATAGSRGARDGRAAGRAAAPGAAAGPRAA